jgi:hypothetical protein
MRVDTGDNRYKASNVEKHDDALAVYSTLLSLTPLTPNTVLTKWASAMLIRGSTNEALRACQGMLYLMAWN